MEPPAVPRRLTPELRAWLTAAPPRYPVLVTIREDGSPNASVVWAKLLDDDTVLMNSRFDRAKARHVARDPRVSLCFEDGYQYLTLEGRVTLRPDPDLEDIDALGRHYGDDKDFSPQAGQRVSMVLSIERVLVHLERLP
jgi:PPOX class probable F420-dependent enzyme